MNHAVNRGPAPPGPLVEVETVEIGGYTVRTAATTPAPITEAAPLLVFNGFGATLDTLSPLMSAFKETARR